MSVANFDFSLVSGPRRLLHRRCSITDSWGLCDQLREEKPIITRYRFRRRNFRGFYDLKNFSAFSKGTKNLALQSRQPLYFITSMAKFYSLFFPGKRGNLPFINDFVI